MGRTAFEVYLGDQPATERLAFDHDFDPASRVPPPMFWCSDRLLPVAPSYAAP